jgi:outer membrane lipoprotein carrier protein
MRTTTVRSEPKRHVSRNRSLRALVAGLALLAPLASSSSTEAQPAPATASLSKADRLVSTVQALYDQSTTFKSDFDQRFWVKAYNTEKSSHGHVTFAKPGKMDWTYDDPKDNRIVSDGSVIRIYDAANKQMYEQQVDKSQYPAALSFLTGTGQLGAAFDFELFAGEQMKFPGGSVLVGTPKQPTPAYAKVLFYVDTATSQVRRVLVIDGQGNRNRFDFSNSKINEPVGANQFTFKPPPGTSIVRP